MNNRAKSIFGGDRLKPLRIGMLAPPWFSVPPAGYGGIEAMCHWLTESLVDRGHEVHLIAAGEAQTKAHFHQTFETPPSLRLGQVFPDLIHHAKAMNVIDGLDLDIVHDHTQVGPILAQARRVPTVVTAHGSVEGEIAEYFRTVGKRIGLIAISEAQRRLAPDLPWVGTALNAVPVDEFQYQADKEDFILFLGRMSPEKGVHLAIRAAREAGFPLVIAAKCNEPLEYEYLEDEVKPLLGAGAEWIGEPDSATKKDLLARARCLILPVQWQEPFGLVMVEALASGTPVVALPGGAVPEIVIDGETGFICGSPEDLVRGIELADKIDPLVCRDHAKQNFDIPKMVQNYENIYRFVLQGGPSPKTVELTIPSSVGVGI